MGAAGTLVAVASGLTVPGTIARSGGFRIGEDVDVIVHALNLRAGPGTDHEVLAVLSEGAVGTVLDGPVFGETYAWYKVDFGAVGWVASAFIGSYAPPETLQGLRIQVVDGPLNLRDAPSLSGAIIASLPVGTTMRVTQADGGTWADGYHWIAVWVEAQNPVTGFVADAFTARL